MEAEGIGQARLACAAIDRKHRGVIKAFAALAPSVADGIAHKKNAGYQRALDRLFTAMPIRPYAIHDRAVIFRSLRCIRAPFDDGQQHDYVEVRALVVGETRNGAVAYDAPWGLLVGFHALARMWERGSLRFTNPTVDFAAAVLRAHDTLIDCPYEVFEAARWSEDSRWVLPVSGSDGAFACRVRYANAAYDNDTIPVVQGFTFVSSSQYWPDQVAQAAAMEFRPTIDPIGRGIMLPPQLRPKAPRNENGMASLPITSNLSGPRKNARLPKVEMAHLINKQQDRIHLC